LFFSPREGRKWGKKKRKRKTSEERKALYFFWPRYLQRRQGFGRQEIVGKTKDITRKGSISKGKVVYFPKKGRKTNRVGRWSQDNIFSDEGSIRGRGGKY